MNLNEIKDGYTRVTEVLTPFSGLSNVPESVLNNAADRGCRVHAAIDSYIKGFGFFPEDDVINYMTSFYSWADGKTFIDTPKRFYIDTPMKLTGECDSIYQSDEGLVLVDFKTPAKEGKTWHLQGSCYSYMAKQAGLDIKRIEFVRVRKDGKPAIVYNYEEDWPSFELIYSVYDKYFRKKDNKDFGYEYL